METNGPRRHGSVTTSGRETSEFTKNTRDVRVYEEYISSLNGIKPPSQVTRSWIDFDGYSSRTNHKIGLSLCLMRTCKSYLTEPPDASDSAASANW
eukprot:4890485-Amphidinium_carterae.2